MEIEEMYDDNEPSLENAELFADSNLGIYIPQYFAKAVTRKFVEGLTPQNWETLEAGPDDELYWDTWASVLDNAKINHPVLGACYLYQDGDLWIVPRDGFHA
jgi:hypothetical protein